LYLTKISKKPFTDENFFSRLQQNKQDQLKALTKIALDKVAAEMIILFGSYAPGVWWRITRRSMSM